MKEIKAIIQPFVLERVCAALREIEGLPGVTDSQVQGWGKSRAVDARHTAQEEGVVFARKTKVELVVPVEQVARVVSAIEGAAHASNPGDEKIFVYDVEVVVKIRTG